MILLTYCPYLQALVGGREGVSETEEAEKTWRDEEGGGDRGGRRRVGDESKE